MPLGLLTIDLVARLANLERDMGRAAQVAERNGKKMTDAFDGFNAKIRSVEQGLKTLFAGYSAAQAWQGLVQGPATAADEMAKFSQRTGIATETLSRLNYAAGLNDASLSDLEQGLKGLSNKMLDVVKGGQESTAAFEALDVKVTDSAGKLRPVDDVLLDLADSFKALPDGATKSALAMKVMEESGIKLIPLLNNGRDGLRQMADEADRFGVTISGQAASAAVEFNDNLTRLKAVSQGVSQQIGNELIPIINQVADTFVRANDKIGSFGLTLNAQINAALGVAGGGPLEQQIAEVNRMLAEVEGWRNRLPGGIFGTLFGVRESNLHALREVLLAQKEIADAAKPTAVNLRAVENAMEAQATAADRAVARAQEYAAKQKLAAEAAKAAAAASKADADAKRAAEDAYKRFSDAIKAVAANAEAAADAEAEIIANARDGIDDLEKQVKTQRDNNEEIGLTGKALAQLHIRRLEDAAAAEDQNAAMARARGANEAEIEAYEEKARLLRELANLQKDGQVKDAIVQSAEAARSAWKDIADDVAESLTDAILQGGDAWKTLVKSIEATVIRATILPVVQGGVQAILQAVGLGPSGGGGGGGNLLGTAGNAASLFNTGSSLMGYGQAAYTGYTAAAGGTDLTSAIAAYNSSGYYGTAASLQAGQAAGGVSGAGAASALPYLGYAALFLVGAQWFAQLGSGVRRFGAAAETAIDETGQVVTRLLDDTNDSVGIIDASFARAFESNAQARDRLLGLYSGDLVTLDDGRQAIRNPDGGGGDVVIDGRGSRLGAADPVLTAANEAVIRATGEIVRQLTGQDSPLFSVASSFLARGGDDSTGRIFVRGAGGENLLNFNQDFSRNGGFEQFGQNFDRVVLAVLGSMSGLDEGLQAIIDAVDPATASLEQVQQAIQVLGDFTAALDAADAFSDVDATLEAVRRASLDATGQFEVMQQDLIAAANAGSLSVDEILGGLGTVYQGFTQLLQNIDAASKSVAESTADNIRNLRLSVLDDAGKYDFLGREYTQQVDVLRSLTDPGLILDYLGRLQGNLNSAFGVLDNSEQLRLVDDFAARFEYVGQIAQQQLEVAQDQATASLRETTAEMRAAIREEFAAVAANFQAAANTISNTTVGVSVNVDVDTPARVEVGTFVLGDN